MSTHPDPIGESKSVDTAGNAESGADVAAVEVAGQSASKPVEPLPAARDPSPRPKETPAKNLGGDTRRSPSRLPLVVALLALAAAGYAAYGQWQLQRQPPAPPVAAVSSEVNDLLARQSRQAEANGKRIVALESRLEDLQAVNATLREQFLGLGQRQSLSEDVIADLARNNAPSDPKVEISEAEYLLLVGQTRLQLFGDVAGARVSLQLADQVLAASGDPMAGAIRGAVSAELDALNAVPVVDRIALQARLDELSANADQWPLLDSYQADLHEDRLQPWYTRLFERLVDIRQVQIDDPLQPLGPAAARLGFRTHLALARLLLLQGRETEAARSLQDAAQSLALFDPSHPDVAKAQRGLAEIANLPLGAPLPTLGTALDELRRVRNLRGMANPQPAGPGSP
ncbi:MAG: uroporphyrinogen-III C-methyltransferase [Xanthomonadales bacterium]|nr:uroporphyrinogen-III C-methyltransferase [Xanthomonadales bacterium]